MRPSTKIYLLAIISLLFAACKKEVVPASSITGQPVFSFNGTIGGTEVNLKAGVNNYYMYSSFMQDTVGHDTVVYGFIGNLQSTATSKNSIQITINDYKVSVINASVSNHIDSAFSQSAYLYNNPRGDTTGYMVRFTPIIYHGPVSAFTYSFGDGSPNITTVYSTPIVHTYPTTTAIYTSSLNMDFTACGPVTAYNPISIVKVPFPITIDSISSTPGIDSANYFPLTFTATISNGTAPYTYLWKFGDGDSTTVSNNFLNCTVTHAYTIPSTFPISLRVTDHSGNSQVSNYTVWDSNSTYSGCLANYKISVPLPIISNSFPLSEISIQYTDGDGNVYTSKNSSQPGISSFQILSVSTYKNNMNNEPTKELTVKFNCQLYNIISGSPVSATGTAVIAVAFH